VKQELGLTQEGGGGETKRQPDEMESPGLIGSVLQQRKSAGSSGLADLYEEDEEGEHLFPTIIKEMQSTTGDQSNNLVRPM